MRHGQNTVGGRSLLRLAASVRVVESSALESVMVEGITNVSEARSGGNLGGGGRRGGGCIDLGGGYGCGIGVGLHIELCEGRVENIRHGSIGDGLGLRGEMSVGILMASVTRHRRANYDCHSWSMGTGDRFGGSRYVFDRLAT